MTDKESKAIKAITEIRAANNILWMGLLKLALQAKKRKARAILKKIQANDKKVTKWTGRL